MKKTICVLAALLLAFGLAACVGAPENSNGNGKEDMSIYITVGETRLFATLEENAATAELAEKLKSAPVTVNLRDYGGFEKVGSFGFSLTASDVYTVTEPCDFVLYQGNQLVIFYRSNSWDYTPLGKITGVTPERLKEVLGSGDVSVTLSV